MKTQRLLTSPPGRLVTFVAGALLGLGLGIFIAAQAGLGLTVCMALAEELVFRGVGFRALRAMCGDWSAIGLSALLFGAYHVIGSPNRGMGLVFQFVLPALGGLLFGRAVVRSSGLSLALGLHWGGNWIQASVAGFVPVAALQPPQALWRIPITDADLKVLTAPDLLSRLPYMAAIGMAAVLACRRLRTRQAGLNTRNL